VSVAKCLTLSFGKQYSMNSVSLGQGVEAMETYVLPA